MQGRLRAQPRWLKTAANTALACRVTRRAVFGPPAPPGRPAPAGSVKSIVRSRIPQNGQTYPRRRSFKESLLRQSSSTDVSSFRGLRSRRVVEGQKQKVNNKSNFGCTSTAKTSMSSPRNLPSQACPLLPQKTICPHHSRKRRNMQAPHATLYPAFGQNRSCGPSPPEWLSWPTLLAGPPTEPR